jgi:hypothetical protein
MQVTSTAPFPEAASRIMHTYRLLQLVPEGRAGLVGLGFLETSAQMRAVQAMRSSPWLWVLWLHLTWRALGEAAFQSLPKT